MIQNLKKQLPLVATLQAKKFAALMSGALKNGGTVYLKTKHLTPNVLIDNKDTYKAEYVDDFGNYIFEIKRIGKKWIVTSDGYECLVTKDKKHLIWEFECQLANFSPKVLK